MAGEMEAVSRKISQKTLDLVIRAARLTPELLQKAMRTYLEGKATHAGKVRVGSIASESGSKLDNIEITDSNIKDFKRIADKHHVQYALRRDSAADPPVYHVFFQTGRAENFQKAFAEYAGVMSDKLKKKQYEMPREKQQQIAADMKREYAKEQKQLREKNRGEIQR
mgnify:FL=1